MGKGGVMASLASNFGTLGGALYGGSLAGSVVTQESMSAMMQQAYINASSTVGWQIGYSPSTNTVQYYRQDEVGSQSKVARKGPILERLRAEIKEWHGDVLKVAG